MTGPYLAGSRWIFFVPEACADHGVSHTVAPKLLLSAGFEVNDGQPGLIEGFCQGHVLLPAWKVVRSSLRVSVCSQHSQDCLSISVY